MNTKNIENKKIRSSKNHTDQVNNLRAKQNELMLMISRAGSFEDVEKQFNQLYDSMVRSLWESLSGKFIPPLLRDELQDIFQESWIKLLEQRTKYDGNKDVFNWVYTIIKNLVIDNIRKMKRHHHISIDEQNENDENVSLDFTSYEISEEDRIAEREKKELVWDALMSISDETIKDLLIRRIVRNQKLEKISADTGIPLTTVHKKIKKGLNLIKPKIEKILTS